jgi:2-octaprenyl-3-methyl-6-methoxy-1,4-benzoquinol hydroxylase/2-octaprenylphenol hydroxylase
MSNPERYDVIVVGGGMVGAATAALLGRCGISVGLVEASHPPEWRADDPHGLRVSALSPGSQAILAAAGAWQGIEAGRCRPYRRMHIEDRDGSSALEFTAPEFGLERLGTIVENDLVQSTLWKVISDHAMIDVHCPARPRSCATGPDGVRLELEGGQCLEAKLLIGADGAGSRVRAWLGAEEQVWDYNQKGLVCVVRKSMANPGVAWQRFLPGGPLAFLPLDGGYSSIVWTLPTTEADRFLAMPEEDFIQELAAASDGWLGEVETCGPRGAFPLTMRLSDRYVAERLVLLGDSAHQVHPLAGQGVNLGLADAAALIETLVAGRAPADDLAAPGALRRFERWRRSESGLMAQGIHALGGLFQPDELTLPRKLGMAAVSRSWLLGEAFVLRAAGLGRNAPRLSRGDGLRGLLGKH